MVNFAQNALKDADVILWIQDVSRAPNAEDQHIADLLARICAQKEKDSHSQQNRSRQRLNMTAASIWRLLRRTR